jgi:CheY-like chemotaxis protein
LTLATVAAPERAAERGEPWPGRKDASTRGAISRTFEEAEGFTGEAIEWSRHAFMSSLFSDTTDAAEEPVGRLSGDETVGAVGGLAANRIASGVGAESEERDDGPDSTRASGSKRRALRILLVEDNADTLNYLTKVLRTRGHEVRPAPDLSTALEVAERSTFDVLVSDIELPDGSGLELMWQLKSRGHVAGIAVSGFGSPEDVEMSRAAGFADHLTKPVDFRQLEATIQRLTAAQGLSELVGS